MSSSTSTALARGLIFRHLTSARAQVETRVGLVSVKAQGAVPLGDRSYHVWSGLIERASSVLVFIMVFRHDMSHL